MKLNEWFKRRSKQEWAMVAAIVMLLVMIATRWGYTTRTAGEAFRQRFTPPTAQTDSLNNTDSAVEGRACPTADSTQN